MGGESAWHAVFDGLISTSKTRHFHNSTLLRGTCKTREGQRPRCPYDSESRATRTLPLPGFQVHQEYVGYLHITNSTPKAIKAWRLPSRNLRDGDYVMEVPMVK